jgi:hypothetical protein
MTMAGSILILPYAPQYPNPWNARATITNSGPSNVAAHIFFVDHSGSQSDYYFCLPSGESLSLDMLDYNPMTTSTVYVFPTDNDGYPIAYNHLSATCLVRSDGLLDSPGHPSGVFKATYNAYEFQALTDPLPPWVITPNSTVLIPFDGILFSKFPSKIGFDPLPSRLSGNSMEMYITYPEVNVLTTTSPGTCYGILHDVNNGCYGFQIPATNSLSWPFGDTVAFSATVPRLAPRLDMLLPAGDSGWVTVFNPRTANSTPILGLLRIKNEAGDSFVTQHVITQEAGTATIEFPIFLPPEPCI